MAVNYDHLSFSFCVETSFSHVSRCFSFMARRSPDRGGPRMYVGPPSALLSIFPIGDGASSSATWPSGPTSAFWSFELLKSCGGAPCEWWWGWGPCCCLSVWLSVHMAFVCPCAPGTSFNSHVRRPFLPSQMSSQPHARPAASGSTTPDPRRSRRSSSARSSSSTTRRATRARSRRCPILPSCTTSRSARSSCPRTPPSASCCSTVYGNSHYNALVGAKIG